MPAGAGRGGMVSGRGRAQGVFLARRGVCVLAGRRIDGWRLWRPTSFVSPPAAAQQSHVVGGEAIRRGWENRWRGAKKEFGPFHFSLSFQRRAGHQVFKWS